MPIVPHTAKIFERLLKPLKSAKRNYSLGDYLATVSTCGIVGEMLTILIWEINDVRLNNKPLSKSMEKVILGHSFEERLSQDRRLKILKAFGLISESQYQELNSIREIRNRYLHSWKEESLNEKKDAFDTIKYAFRIFREITGIGIGDEPGTIKINPKLLKLFE
jgi:HEPN domain-containing protein